MHSLSFCSRRIPWHRQLAGTATPAGMARLAPSPWRAGGSERLPQSPAAAPSTSCPALGWPLQPWLPEQHPAIEQMCRSGPGIHSIQRCCILLAELLHAGGKLPCPCLTSTYLPLPHLQGKSWSLNAMPQKTLSASAVRVDTISRAGPRSGTAPPMTSVKTVSAPCSHWPQHVVLQGLVSARAHLSGASPCPFAQTPASL